MKRTRKQHTAEFKAKVAPPGRTEKGAIPYRLMLLALSPGIRVLLGVLAMILVCRHTRTRVSFVRRPRMLSLTSLTGS